MLTYTLRLISCIISGFYIDNTKFILQDLDNFVFQTTDKVKYLYTFGLTEVVHTFCLITMINLSRQNASKTFHMNFSAKIYMCKSVLKNKA